MTPRRRASAVCVDSGELLCVRLRDPKTRVLRLFVPGGAIELFETTSAAAEREVLEETGYLVRVDPSSELVARYPFVWAGHEIDCTTHFFLARLCSDKRVPSIVHDAPYNEGAVWLPLCMVDAELGFHPEILRHVRALAASFKH